MDVDAGNPWYDTKLDVLAGELLRFTVSGSWQDKQFPSGPEGFRPPLPLRLSHFLLRHPRGVWFELTGTVGRTNRAAFSIGDGKKGPIAMPASGRLYLFANDVPGFYGNNSGHLSVAIERVGAG